MISSIAIYCLHKLATFRLKKTSAPEAVIFVSVFLNLLTNRLIRNSFKILRYFTDNNIWFATKNLEDPNENNQRNLFPPRILKIQFVN